MERKVYIVPTDYNQSQAATEAKINNVSEVAFGIPPRYDGLINAESLPTVYTEIIPDPVTTAVDLARDDLAALAGTPWDKLSVTDQNALIAALITLGRT